jgi:predicted dithiol-disulfide oxidoreductase (DUF899 family)
MDWHFPWVSSDNNASNDDFRVSFKPDEMAAGTAFYNFRRTNPGLEDLSGDSVLQGRRGRDFSHGFHLWRGGDRARAQKPVPQGRQGGTDWPRSRFCPRRLGSR